MTLQYPGGFENRAGRARNAWIFGISNKFATTRVGGQDASCRAVRTNVYCDKQAYHNIILLGETFPLGFCRSRSEGGDLCIVVECA